MMWQKVVGGAKGSSATLATEIVASQTGWWLMAAGHHMCSHTLYNGIEKTYIICGENSNEGEEKENAENTQTLYFLKTS